MNTVIFAAKDPRLVAGILVASAIALTAIFLIASAFSSHRRRAEVPWAIQPGPSDDELESKTLPRFLAVGTIFLLFLSVYLPAYWLREPTRISLKEDQFHEDSILRGSVVYAEHAPPDFRGAHFSANCARCHGPTGEGTTQPFKEDFTYAEPPLKYMVARYKAAGKNDDEIRLIMVDAIERGRPGTLMPTWGLAFGGPLNSQQVDDVVNFIYSLQEPFPGVGDVAVSAAGGAQLFETNCAVCHMRRSNPEDPKSPLVWGGVGPDLRGVIAKLGAGDREAGIEAAKTTIHEGRINYSRPSMPAWAHLGDQAIDALIQFLLSVQTAR